MLELRLLGELKLLDQENAPVPLSRKAASFLLAYLVLNRERAVPNEQLAALLWPEESEEKARGNLRRQLHFLVKDLPESPADQPWLIRDRIATQWNPAQAIRTDVEAFESAIHQGECAIQERRLSDAAEALSESCELHKGELLPQIEAEWVVALRKSLREKMLWALDKQARVFAALNRQEEALRACRRLVEARPDMPTDQIMLMWLLAEHGRPEQAIEIGEALREMRELSQTELVRLREFESALADGESIDEWHPGAHLLRSTEKPIPSEGLSESWPLYTDAFVGRETEVDQLRELLSIARLVTLTGPGGAGKTRLALETGASHQAALADWLVWVDLSGLMQGALAERALAEAANVRPEARRPLLRTVTAAIGNQRTLIVLDNCEHVVREAGELVAAVLDDCPRTTILATSRERLDVEGELAWEIPALGTPSERRRGMSSAEVSETETLFVTRVKESWDEFQSSQDNEEAIAKICSLTQGVPLAVELAAARAGVMTLDSIATRLGNDLGVLKRNDRDHPSRHETLEACIEWGYNLLSSDEQWLLRHCAIFANPFDFKAIEAIAMPESDLATRFRTREELFESTSRLAATSFFRAESTASGDSSYRVLDMIRQYGQMRLREENELSEAEARRASYIYSFALEASTHLTESNSLVWVQRLDRMANDVNASLAWLCESKIWNDAAELGVGLARYWFDRGHLDIERARLVSIAREAGNSLPRSLASKVWRGAAVLAYGSADYDEASLMFKQGLDIILPDGDPESVSRLQSDLGLMALIRGDFNASKRHHSEAFQIRRDSKDEVGAAESAVSLADVATRLGEYEKAAALYREAMSVYEGRTGFQPRLVNLQLGLAHVAYCVGDYKKARAHASALLEASKNLKSVVLRASSLSMMGMIESDQGGYDAASAAYAEALRIRRDLSSELEIALVLHLMGENEIRRGRFDSAKAYLTRSLRMKEESDSEWVSCHSRILLAQAQSRSAEPEKAEENLVNAMKLADRFRLRSMVALGHLVDAERSILCGKLVPAAIALSDCIEIEIELGEKRVIAEAVDRASTLMKLLDDESAAQNYAELADRAFQTIGAARLSLEVPDSKRLLNGGLAQEPSTTRLADLISRAMR